jgi:branched-chain amino acid transport system ATP-binding protein
MGFSGYAAVAEVLLKVERLTKRFGGLLASDGIDLDIKLGELHAIIGPNGAGKTTLIGQLTGEIKPDSGQVQLGGQVITALPVYARSRLGLARSFQITSLFSDFTALDNVAFAVQANAGHSFRFWGRARGEDALRGPALTALESVGLGERAEMVVSDMSHGEHRLLELAIALSTQPRMLLLDEPMAGLGPEEATRMVAMLAKLRNSMTILLIEHDMEAVFALADRISVLVNGRVIASGSPAEIRADVAVRQAYLGDNAPVITHV